MRKFFQYLLKRPFTWVADHIAAAPKRADVFKSLSKIYRKTKGKKNKQVCVIDIDVHTDRFIIFSDQHKGNKDHADDFLTCAPNYIAALNHYHSLDFTYINLGDCEELWKYTAAEVLPAYKEVLQAEADFQVNKKYYRTFGNHDIIWKNKVDVTLLLKKYFPLPFSVTEAVALRTTVNGSPLDIMLTHGHQGDKMSDNNAFSTWIVAHLWTPLQRYLRININTASKDFSLRSKHNKMMYEWSSKRKNLLLVTGHTHQPVFASGKYLDHPAAKIDTQETPFKVKPSYFNTGCCCFDDGDITGIEIADGNIALIKWFTHNGIPCRMVLEEKSMEELVKDL